MGINTPALRAYVLNPIRIIYTSASHPYRWMPKSKRCELISLRKFISKNGFRNLILIFPFSKFVSLFPYRNWNLNLINLSLLVLVYEAHTEQEKEVHIDIKIDLYII